jgi:phage terminase large subunit-like protein
MLHWCFFDECAMQPVGGELYKAIEKSICARTDGGMVYYSSTAGNSTESFWYALVVRGRRILKGDDKEDYRTLPILFEPGEKDDYHLPATWHKANPIMATGKGFTEDMFREAMHIAKNTRAEWLDFCRRRLNVFTTDESAWWAHEDLKTCFVHKDDAELLPHPAFIGMDLSATVDTSAVATCHKLPGDRYHIRCMSFVCAEGVKRRNATLLPKYETFGKDVLQVHKGRERIDYNSIEDYIVSQRKWQLRRLATDQWNADQVCDKVKQFVPISRMPQGFNMNFPIKQFEVALKEGRLTFEPNELMKWQMQNAMLVVNRDGTCRLDKDSSKDKIDAVISAVMAYGAAISYKPAFTSWTAT